MSKTTHAWQADYVAVDARSANQSVLMAEV